MQEPLHNRDKYPEIWATFERKVARKKELMAARKVHTDAMQAKFAEVEHIKAELETMSVAASADKEEIYEVSREISTLARAMGAKTISAPLPPAVSPF